MTDIANCQFVCSTTCMQPANYNEGIMNEQEDGYSGMFYIMLIVGIVGVLGFVLVAAGAGS
jgi:hypothetical protein